MKRTALTASLRVRDCETCGKPFQQARSMQAVCSPRCALRLPKVQAKREKAADKEKREAQQKLPYFIAKAQTAVNAYILARDAGNPCICCGRFSNGAGAVRGGEWDAGHYRSRGAAPELRFDERNIHAQLKYCNRRGWDVAGYRANLIGKIGLAEVEALEGPHPPRKWTIPALKALAAEYRAKARALK